MGWLRKERDLIGLVMVWGLLLQSLIIPFSTSAHAAARTSDADVFGIICTSGTSTPVPNSAFDPDRSKQSRNGSDCKCCHMSCSHSCGGSCGGLLGALAYVIRPQTGAVSDAALSQAPAAYDTIWLANAQPRAPPGA